MRRRERGSYHAAGSYLDLGTSYIDVTVPYGNGPWVYPTIARKTFVVETPDWEEVCVDELHKGPPWRSGGPLDLYKMTTDQYQPKGECDLINRLWRYKGAFIPSLPPTFYLSHASLQAFEASDAGNVESFGAAGWNKFRPTNSGAQLGVALGEIHEIPRMLQTTAKGFHQMWRSMGGSLSGFGPKNVANHWLNTQFGWFPFLADLRDFFDITKNLDTRLKQLRRDNGRWIRRRGIVDRSNETTVVASDSMTNHWPIPSSYVLVGPPWGSRLFTRLNEQIVWFKGAFRYWIPGKPDSWQWKTRAVTMLYGLQPSPSLIWELTPWSWLIDWCADAGDALANLSSILYDNLCAKYAYVMGTTSQTVTSYSTLNTVKGPNTQSWSASLTRKTRHAASPFGFGLTGGDFSTRQWSILSALGLTRMGR